jgi:hypothetical protein
MASTLQSSDELKGKQASQATIYGGGQQWVMSDVDRRPLNIFFPRIHPGKVYQNFEHFNTAQICQVD